MCERHDFSEYTGHPPAHCAAAPLRVQDGKPSEDLLTPGLYKKFAQQLHTLGAQPADLLTGQAGSIVTACADIIDGDRLQRLLGRGFLLSQAIERWQARSIWVVSRADPEYPRRLKQRLREDTPPVLYGCGSFERLNNGGLAIVGSRHINDDLVAYTEAVGAMAAQSGSSVVSGGARGIDQAAMRGAIDAGGQVTGVLADSLEKNVMLRSHREPLRNGRLILISPNDPDIPFHVGLAMQRNKLIYALADAALVVSSDLGKGGTWAGAIEQLKKFRFVPIYVRQAQQANSKSDGLDALLQQGGIAWPEPQDHAAFSQIFQHDTENKTSTPNLFAPRDATAVDKSQRQIPVPAAIDETRNVAPAGDLPAARLWSTVRPIMLDLLKNPCRETDITTMLDITKPQAKEWLQKLTGEGLIIKEKSKYYISPEKLL